MGFHEWYLSQLPDELKKKADELLVEQFQMIKELETDEFTKQYYIPLGYKVPCRLTFGLPAAVYVAELRSSRYVHPTLREMALRMHDALQDEFPTLKLHCDLEKDDWDIRRGLQDITSRES
jgi:hypothetical protein